MAQIQPFRAWRPRPELAPQVASPPYDVLSSEEARQQARGDELTFLHVVKPEIDLPPNTPPHDPRIYAKGAENLQRLCQQGALVREETPALYVYQQRMGEHVQAGLVAGASIDEYEGGAIKKHEHTRPDKEDDRARHIDALGANTGPVFLTYRATAEIDRRVDEIRSTAPTYDFTSPDEIQHTLWVVREPSQIDALREAFAGVPHLYVADGHHRSAAATRVRAARRDANPDHRGDEPYNFFLAVIFPHDQMKILPYNRVVHDLGGLSNEAFRQKVDERFTLAPTSQPAPDRPHCFGLYLAGRWERLTARPGTFLEAHPVASLDAAILQNNLLAPVLGIEDPRRDKRIDFVGGIRGTGELERRCQSGSAAAFALYPTRIEQLMQVADAGEVMPPKSTWFEPKLRSGLIVRSLEG
ncbi:MAG: DUF1015 family protein [Candidatus Eisenbacteria bacterium]|nr:DUF1015 family protein [Candidatus Eisenbacteria bacterium]